MTVLLLCMTSCEPVTRTELHEAIRAGDMAAVQQCLAARPGAVHDRDVLGDTPLHVAAQTGKVEIAELLLARGADVNAKAYAGWTALHWAAYWQHPAMADLLLNHQAGVDARNSLGVTPLHWAATRGNTALIERLLASHANVNGLDDEHRTPLHYATYWEQIEAVKVLIAHNADVNARQKADLHPHGNAITPLDIADFYGRFAIAKLLREHGAQRERIPWMDKPSTTRRPQR